MSYDDNYAERLIADCFHVVYYVSNVWNHGNTKWLGKVIFQHPMDMWVKQDIIFETRPTVIVESGTAAGGSALYYATIFDQLGKGKVVSIDLQDSGAGKPDFTHPRIVFIKGDCLSPKTLSKVKGMIKKSDRVMVVLDSDHKTEHVTKEIKLYAPLVTVGCYLIVEDTNLGGHPVMNPTVPGPGPGQAVYKFIETNKDFEIDKSRHKFFMTWCPDGFLRRVE